MPDKLDDLDQPSEYELLERVFNAMSKPEQQRFAQNLIPSSANDFHLQAVLKPYLSPKERSQLREQSVQAYAKQQGIDLSSQTALGKQKQKSKPRP